MTDNQKPPENNPNESNSGEKQRSKAFYIRLIIVYAVCILLILLAVNYDSFAKTITKFTSVLMPILYGLVIAYLCNPLFKLFFEKALVKIKSVRWRKTLSMLLTYVIVILLIFAILFVLIEQMVINVQNFLSNIDTYINNTEGFIIGIVNNLGFIRSEGELNGDTAPPDDQGTADSENVVNIINFNFSRESIVKLISDFFDNSQALISTIGNAVLQSGTAAAITVFNVFLGFIFSVYILFEKDMLCAKAKKLTTSLFKPERAKRYIALTLYSNKKIGHFIKGKLLESFIVGVLAYISFLIFKVPSPLMIAMIVAIMNMIPVFGPFLGAIPAAFLVLIIDPSKTLVYIIIVVIIMQINGNYISPRIVGNSTGLTPLGAITALVLMSGYFGIIGMFIGIPICAILVELLWSEMNKRLDERELSSNLDDYYSPETLAILTEERAKPPKYRNLLAVMVDGTIFIFNKIFHKSEKTAKNKKIKVKKPRKGNK